MSHQKQVYFNANHSTITTDSYNLSMLVASCKKLVKADRLQKGDLGGSIESTISFNADRKRYLSGIFFTCNFSKLRDYYTRSLFRISGKGDTQN